MYLPKEILWILIGMAIEAILIYIIYRLKGWDKEINNEINLEDKISVIRNKLIEKLPEWQATKYADDQDINKTIVDIINKIDKR